MALHKFQFRLRLIETGDANAFRILFAPTPGIFANNCFFSRNTASALPQYWYSAREMTGPTLGNKLKAIR
jgi:hypothetical protein